MRVSTRDAPKIGCAAQIGHSCVHHTFICLPPAPAATHPHTHTTTYLAPCGQVFRSPRDVSEAIQDAVSMLQVPRSALAITASSKGLVGGRLIIHDQRSGGRGSAVRSKFVCAGGTLPTR